MTRPRPLPERGAAPPSGPFDQGESEEVRAGIAGRLDDLASSSGVRILYACEGGSRSFGFAAPDSDYDVRFLYAHPQAWYVTVADRPEVLEPAVDGPFELVGWDLRKALRLLGKSNPSLLEWLDSPIVYQERTGTARRMRELAALHASPRACAHSYLEAARRNQSGPLQRPEVDPKDYLYTLRPLLALRWLERRGAPVPVAFSALVEAELDDAEARRATEDLVARRRSGRLPTAGPPIAALDAFVRAELRRREKGLHLPTAPPPREAHLDQVLHAALMEAWAEGV